MDSNALERLASLAEHIDFWLGQYTDEDFKTKDDGMDVIVLAHDNKSKHAMKFMLVNQEDPRESVVQAFNHGIGNFFDETNEEGREIFQGMCEWLAKLFAQYPNLKKQFDENVKYYEGKHRENELDEILGFENLN